MLENFILGLIQGIAEWLPISSEGLIVVVKTKFFGVSEVGVLMKEALFLHLGTFFAALMYFRKDVKKLLNVRSLEGPAKNVFIFLIAATLASGALGYILFRAVSVFGDSLDTKKLMLAVGVLLLITAFLQFRSGKKKFKSEGDISRKDGLLLGVVQGLAVLPGLSRSGTTVAALLARGYDDALSLRLSFLMSLPVVLAGNIFLNLKDLKFDLGLFVGFATAFVFGLLTIDLLIRLAKKVQFGYFAVIFALLSFAAAFI